ncbi:LmbE-like protein [Lentinula raphanica]|nr:LmbE-like protein [Lentinula raphanica]
MFLSSFHVLILSIVIAVLYRPSSSGGDFDSTQLQRVLLVTAHPDDECLFFSPTILGLKKDSSRTLHASDSEITTKKQPASELFSLCLSVGDADGLGHVRKEEYERSMDVLGIEAKNRMTLDDPYLQDDIESFWNIDYIADVVADFIISHNITTILTFDQDGVSDHPNHRAIPFGIQRMMSAYPMYPPPKFYVLITVPLSIKYVGILAPLVVKFDFFTNHALHYLEDRLVWFLDYLGYAATIQQRPFDDEKRTRQKVMPVFVSGIDDYFVGLRAMRQHWSQLVWFRWLNVVFSRYMWVNEWAEVTLHAKE